MARKLPKGEQIFTIFGENISKGDIDVQFFWHQTVSKRRKSVRAFHSNNCAKLAKQGVKNQ